MKKEKILEIAVLLLIILQPIMDMDYLIYDFLDQFGIPRLSTIVRFIIIPLMIIACFFLKDKDKKKTFILGAIYGIALGGYFVLHCKQGADLYPVLDLTTNFKFSIFQELTYVLTLVMPIGMVYLMYHVNFDRKTLKFITVFLSSVISIPILIGDLFVFGKSTYFGYTVANFFSWFNGIYEAYHPRTLASKFFFNEGNTLGILLFMLLPLMFYWFSESEEKKEKIYLGGLILIQSLSMQILATRVATYGAVLIPIIFIAILIVDFLVKKFLNKEEVKLDLKTIGLCVLCTLIFFAILDFTPAVQNQKVDAVNDVALITNGAADEGRSTLKDGDELIPGTKEYNDFYIFMFETYGIKARYITSVPSMYYVDYYNYKFDPKFWVDVTFMDVYDRVSGRQIQTIFMNYKYAKVSFIQKFLGMGYSTFMNGSIVLEQDFKQQIYTLGYIGEVLCVLPWILVVLWGVVMVLMRFNKLVNKEIMCYAFALVAALGCAYMSGHTLDQFVTTVFMSLVTSVLIRRILEVKHGED
ncbi:MAG: O-antigen ligase family protein [Erysipelotrichaceae bacterium]|nr:O-antigen ligase family protein [Erysipelotrichaceae bacterium]